jgi:hypothetical protein
MYNFFDSLKNNLIDAESTTIVQSYVMWGSSK